MDEVSDEEKAAGTRESGFKKFDQGKIDYTLPPPELETAVATIMAFGALKYDRDNWQLCEDPNDYMKAIKRHENEMAKGNVIDKDSGKPHTWHILTNYGFLVWFQERAEPRNNTAKGIWEKKSLDILPGSVFQKQGKKKLTDEERYENF